MGAIKSLPSTMWNVAIRTFHVGYRTLRHVVTEQLMICYAKRNEVKTIRK